MKLLPFTDRLSWRFRYGTVRQPKIKAWVPGDPETHRQIRQELCENGFTLEDWQIDVADFRRYLSAARYERFARYYDGGRAKNFTEKALEHYVAAQMLGLSQGDTYIDIANAYSPVPEIYNELYGCKAYRQDLMFPEGIDGDVIGGDAGNMPVEDGFGTKMALHCSFEHFEGDSDVRFIREAGRVLSSGGKLCILPLYLFTRYAIQTDPIAWPRDGMQFEPDAVVYCAEGWGDQHGRFYSVPKLISRIRDNLNSLQLTIYVVQNEKDVDPSCYVKFAAVFEKP